MGEASAATAPHPNTVAAGPKTSAPTMGGLMRFFVPLGFAACLVSVTHFIINATLTKAAQPELAIAAYAICGSLFGLTERPAVLVRQTCSALVRDRISFRAMSGVTWMLIAATVAFGAFVCYTPFGPFVFRDLYGVDPKLLPAILTGYQFFMWVSVFSALRCLYHGVIISQMRTKWVTIGMIVRLAGMFAISQYFIHSGGVSGAWVGALLFAAGMLIEAGVCYWEGRTLARNLPERIEQHGVTSKRHIFAFYRPLLYSSFIVLAVGPALNALLGRTIDVELSIASFAVASSVFNVIMSVFTYIHQIVLNFYPTSPRLVFRFQRVVAFAPGLLTAALAFTPAGPFVLEAWMGLTGRLLPASLVVLQAFALLGLLLPWVDFGNGFLMLFRRTHVFMWSQSANTAASLAVLVGLVVWLPSWNGVIGPLVLAAGSAAELGVVAFALYRARWEIGWARRVPGR